MFYCIGICVEAQQVTITTQPFLPNNVGATNYVNLQLVSSITGFPIVCHYQYANRASIFYESGSCLPDVSNAKYSSVCEDVGNSITFTYTIRTPLRDDVNYDIVCNFPAPISATITAQVQGTSNCWNRIENHNFLFS